MKPLRRCALTLKMALLCAATSWFGHPAALFAGLPMRSRSTAVPIVPPSAPPTITLQPPPAPPIPPVGALTTSNYSLNREIVRRVIYVHINQIRTCYQQALVRQPTLAGRLVVIFEINPKGQVDDLLIPETSLPAPVMLQCISDTMRSWEFPPTPYYNGSTRIVYPFVLRPKVPEPPSGIEVTDEELAKLGILKDPEPPPVDITF